MLTAGVIGLGQIGSGTALCLAKSGHLTATYDIRSDAAEQLEGVPSCSNSPAEVAKNSDVLVLAVVDAEQVKSVLLGEQGILSTAKPGQVIILLSTVSLTDLRALNKLTEAAQVILVDCGVTGGQAAAEKGMISLVGAEQSIFEKIKPILEAFSKTVIHMGGPEAGMAAKIARNAIVYSVWRVGFEASSLAKAAGVDLQKLAEAIEESAEAVGGAETWMRRDIYNEAEKPIREHAYRMLDKDLASALSLADELHLELPTVQLAKDSGKTILNLED